MQLDSERLEFDLNVPRNCPAWVAFPSKALAFHTSVLPNFLLSNFNGRYRQLYRVFLSPWLRKMTGIANML
jgi:hypothetical protein